MKFKKSFLWPVSIVVLLISAQTLGKAAVVVLENDFYVIPTKATVPASNWGAVLVPHTSRPERAWVSAFGAATVSNVSNSAALQNAIDSCTDYCVIEIDQLNLSETIYINQSKVKLLGKAGNNVTFSGANTAFYVETNVSEVVLEGLNIDGQNTPYSEIYGVLIEGETVNRVLIKDNTFENLNATDDGHGIAVYGSGNSEANSINSIIIEGNTLNNLRTGSSESIVINGNVKHWEIKGNSVSNVNNIAIDAIGGEGTSPTRIVNGRVVPGLVDAAREGFIESNTVTNMSTLSNAQYGNTHSWAAGIYVDGGRDIVIANNSMSGTPWAYELGAENCVATSNVTAVNNSASGSRYGDFLIGGYAANGYREDTAINCNPLTSSDSAEGHGYVENATVKSNSFTSTATEENKFQLQLRIRQSVIIEPGIGGANTDGVVSCDQNSIRISE